MDDTTKKALRAGLEAGSVMAAIGFALLVGYNLGTRHTEAEYDNWLIDVMAKIPAKTTETTES